MVVHLLEQSIVLLNREMHLQKELLTLSQDCYLSYVTQINLTSINLSRPNKRMQQLTFNFPFKIYAVLKLLQVI